MKDEDNFMIQMHKAAYGELADEVSESSTNDLLCSVISDLEYAAFNLCEKTDDDVGETVIESTCPEATLFIAMRKLKQMTAT
jgi:hypothetical protein